MLSLISIVELFLTGKENYYEWSKKIKHTIIFNELWKGLCEGEDDNLPAKPILDKELTIWENKNNNAYAFIFASINEEVSHHIAPITSNSFNALNKLIDLYESHSEPEVV